MASQYLPYAPRIFTPEMEVVYENGLDTYQNCKHNVGHSNFFEMADLKMEMLPPKWQTQDIMDLIQIQYDLTVRISLTVTSPNRPDTYPDSKVPYPYHNLKGQKRCKYGSGLLNHICDPPVVEGQECPCHECRDSGNPKMKYWGFGLYSATHVIFDDQEAADAKIECFYNTKDREGVKTLYGVKVLRPRNDKTRAFTDLGTLMCVTHDMELGEKLSRLCEQYIEVVGRCYKNRSTPDFGVMVSHPHGTCKKITMGRISHITFPVSPKLPKETPHVLEFELICHLPPFHNSDYVEDIHGVMTSSQSENQRQDVSPSENVQKSMEPRSQFSLPPTTTYTLPTSSSFGCKLYFEDECHISVTFPEGTIFTLPNGSVLSIPPEAKFLLFDKKTFCERFDLRKYRFIVYKVDSCPGSSGASVLTFSVNNAYPSFLHHTGRRGKDKKLSGLTFTVPLS